MRTNPFYDFWLFLIGETGPHLGVGDWRYLLVALYWGLLLASIVIASAASAPTQALKGLLVHGAKRGQQQGPWESAEPCQYSNFAEELLATTSWLA